MTVRVADKAAWLLRWPASLCAAVILHAVGLAVFSKLDPPESFACQEPATLTVSLEQPAPAEIDTAEMRHEPEIEPTPEPEQVQLPEPTPQLTPEPIPTPAPPAEKPVARQPVATSPPKPEHQQQKMTPRPPVSSSSVSADTAPSLQRNPAPRYPAAALRKGIEGTCLIELAITVEGRVSNARLMRSSGSHLLDQAALRAVRRWRFRPATKLGHPVPARIEAPVEFKLR